MDSTQAIIRLWRLCVPSGAGPEAGGDGALPLDTLKAVLERELEDKLASLNGESVDDILWRYMSPDENGVVGFLQFWRGMEEILYTCRVHRQHLGVAQLHAINGFRYLRTCVLEMALGDASQERSVFRVSELRYFIRRATLVAGPQGAAFWERQAEELPEDSTMVTGEEVASALLSWLEDLVWNDAEQGGGGVPPITPSTALPSTTRASTDSHWDESDDEVGAAQESDTSSVSPRERERPRSFCAALSNAGGIGSGRPAHHEMEDAVGPWSGPQQPPHQQPPAAWGHGNGLQHRATSPPKQQGVSPYGPAPRRSVIDRRGSQRSSLAESSSGIWSEREGATDRGVRSHTPFEAALVSLMDRFEKRPPVHRSQAHVWRDAVEFQCELRRRLADALPLTFPDFHSFAKEHLSLTARRRRNRSPSPRMRTAIYGRWVPTLMPVLRKIVIKRFECGFQALLNKRRASRQGGLFPPRAAADEGNPTILQRLLKEQCQTAVTLEKNVKISSRAGGLAFCLARLLRAALRGACSVWQHRAFEAPRLPLGSPVRPAPTLPSASPAHALPPSDSPSSGYPPAASPCYVMPSGSPSMLPSASPQGSPVACSSPPMRPRPMKSTTAAPAKHFVRSPSTRGDSARGSPITARGSPNTGTSTPGRQLGRGGAAGGSTPTLGGVSRRISADSPMAARGRVNSGPQLHPPAAGAGRGRTAVGPRSPTVGTGTTPHASPATRGRIVHSTSI